MRSVLALVAILLAGCGGAASPEGSGGVAERSPQGPSAPTGPVAESPTPAGSVPEALMWEEPALGGGRVRGADYAGRDVLLWFWAPW